MFDSTRAYRNGIGNDANLLFSAHLKLPVSLPVNAGHESRANQEAHQVRGSLCCEITDRFTIESPVAVIQTFPKPVYRNFHVIFTDIDPLLAKNGSSAFSSVTLSFGRGGGKTTA